ILGVQVDVGRFSNWNKNHWPSPLVFPPLPGGRAKVDPARMVRRAGYRPSADTVAEEGTEWTSQNQNAGRRNTPGSILRATSCPSLGEPNSWPLATITLPRRMTVVGQPSICQPSQGL